MCIYLYIYICIYAIEISTLFPTNPQEATVAFPSFAVDKADALPRAEVRHGTEVEAQRVLGFRVLSLGYICLKV